MNHRYCDPPMLPPHHAKCVACECVFSTRNDFFNPDSGLCYHCEEELLEQVHVKHRLADGCHCGWYDWSYDVMDSHTVEVQCDHCKERKVLHA